MKTFIQLVFLLTVSLSGQSEGYLLRLVGGTAESNGRVEVSQNGTTWGTVCEDLFGVVEATVACRQLGFVSGSVKDNLEYGRGNGPIYLDNVQCSGSETNIEQCGHKSWGKHNCRHNDDVGISCSRQGVRLQSEGQEGNSGSVKLITNDGWVPVCDTSWDDTDARLACIELGYVDGVALCCSRLGPYGQTDTALFSATSMQCTGNEGSIRNCSYEYQSGGCEYRHQASVICYTALFQNVDTSFAVRLINDNSDPTWGAVEVRHMGIWGQICSDEWDDLHANITCRQLGYAGGVKFGRVSRISSPRWISDLNCKTMQNSLEDCVTREWGREIDTESCDTAHALCYSSRLVIQLVGGTKMHGRVEVIQDNVRGTFCDTSWDDLEANLVCRYLGFVGGSSVLGSYFGPGAGSIMMENFLCASAESIFKCRTPGWRVTVNGACDTHQHDAGVICHDNIRLVNGDHGQGIVTIQTSGSSTWKILCGVNFTDTNARVVCKELGYNNGKKLNAGSFGTFDAHNLGASGLYIRPNIACNGTELSIVDCKYDSESTCYTDSNTNYAAVSCFNGSLPNENYIALSGGIPGYENISGIVNVHINGTLGYACSLFWDDEDADVVCRQLGHVGGIAYQHGEDSQGPFWYNEVNCLGTETSLKECPTGSSECAGGLHAGVLCYNSKKPTLQLVDGATVISGRLQIIVDNIVGSVCNNRIISNNDIAGVACKSLGFIDGELLDNTIPGTGPVLMSNVICDGSEESLFMCVNPGWRSVTPSSCSDHSNDVSIHCFNEARVRGGISSSTSITGRVELNLQGRWMTVCADGFDIIDADIVCQNIGYAHGEPLLPGQFSRRVLRSSVSNMTCRGNEVSPKDCSFNYGGCSQIRKNHASVVCSNSDPSGFEVMSIHPDRFPAKIVIQQYGINGTICPVGWSEEASRVYCHEVGYQNGYTIGIDYSTSVIPLIANVKCSGLETALTQCNFTSSAASVSTETECEDSAVQVYCYSDASQGLDIRLTGGRNAVEGRVEISVGGVWGVVCDRIMKDITASVVCRQLGYVSGSQSSTIINANTYEIVSITDAKCNGDENYLWECPMASFTPRSQCRSPYHAVEVTCTDKVRLQPSSSHGSVQVLSEGSYGLVCADGFSDVAAGVVCREVGFTYGISICCSAYGTTELPLVMTNVRCNGNELSLLDCQYDTSLSECPSLKYASVACSNSPPSAGYELSLDNNNFGTVRLRHFDILGFLCPEGFDDQEAMVICNELGFVGGFAYNSYHNRDGLFDDTRWLSNIGCQGNETSLGRCAGVVFGNIGDCSSISDAAVYCYDNQDYQFRLSSESTRGRVEVNIDGSWGTVCGPFTDVEAGVLCRQLNYGTGIVADSTTFGAGAGPVYISDVRCTGQENKLFECPLTWNAGASPSQSCASHESDAAVQCFDNIRLTNAYSTTYGRLEVLNNNAWLVVCDDGFTDNMALIACKQLGFNYGTSQCCSAVGLLDPSQQLLSVKCQGTETSIQDCVLQPNQCSSGTYVSLNCSQEEIITTDLQIRLSDMDGYYGRVEANQYGFWGPICDFGWDKNAADVVCKELGFVEGHVFSGITNDHAPMMLGKVQCFGNEDQLSDCSYLDRDDDLGCHYNMAGPRRSAGVLCSNHRDSLKLYLSGGGNNFGKVVLSFNGEMGSICSAFLVATIAPVVCRQLGYVDGAEYYGDVADTGLTKTWLSSVLCSAAENSILQCQGVWDQPSSTLCVEPSVICYSSVKLSSGSLSSGAVEVFMNNNWGAVCNHQWNNQNAKVVCRQLGYDNGIPACCGVFGRMDSPAMIDRVSCTGSEKDLLDCTHDAPLTSECGLDYAAVACYNGTLETSYTSLQLGTYGTNNNMGDVRLNVSGMAGRICVDGWDDVDAGVVCRELGFPTGQAYTHMRNSYESKSWGVFITSNVQCRGDESSLNDCAKTEFGTVTSCSSDHYAGVLCYDTAGVFYRLSGGTDSEGRLEVSFDGVWGSLCKNYFTDTNAGVYCRSIGYKTGQVLYGVDANYGAPLSNMYQSDFSCGGNETSLNQCAHSGLDKTTSCGSFVILRCFTSVKLQTWEGGERLNHGPVLIYNGPGDNWLLACDAGFADSSAKVVCQELGYADGKAICCSAYSKNSTEIALNYTLSCNGHESSTSECLKTTPCSSNQYASVVCFEETDIMDETYSFVSSQADASFEIQVNHYGIMGRISSLNWTDSEAKVACSQNGFVNGIAFQHQSTESPLAHILTQKPYWISNVNCKGMESQLSQCTYNTRLKLGNTSSGKGAGVLCYNDDGIQYSLAGGGSNYGRVELTINNVLGTVCDLFWDDNDATVMCRQLGFASGYALSGAYYGMGTGRMWLSYLTCDGTEEHLYQCPHSGSIVDSKPMGCVSHERDASVYCTGNVRLHSGLNTSVGALEIYANGQWNRVCDNAFSNQEAAVACKTLGFQDGRRIGGSAFGDAGNMIGISDVKCTGVETDILKCDVTYGTNCISGQYISLYCDSSSIVDPGFQMRLISESEAMKNSGYIEANIGGIWGGICMDSSWNDNATAIACKQLGYSGGVSYRPQSDPNNNMMVLSDVRCLGTESDFSECDFNEYGNVQFCSFQGNHAGVYCSTSQDGVAYRLTGGTPSSGRLEIGVGGNWGGICDWQWDSRDARIACRSLGFQDGLAVYGKRFGTMNIPIWLARVQCYGNESSILNCIHSGFNNTDDYYVQFCSGFYGNAAVQCYGSPIELSDVRLAGGDETHGRVEVYLEGPDQWGTVCSDYWNNIDATVVCKQLGFALGKSIDITTVSIGTGPIWLDNVGCYGNETKVQDCPFLGFSVHNCNHRQDAAVMCSGVSPVTEQLSQNEGAKTLAIVLPVLSILLVVGLTAAILWYRKWNGSKTDFPDKSSRGFTFENIRALFHNQNPDSDRASTLQHIDIVNSDEHL